ncbi:MAG TPA: M14-type cytosolic carboxypeptidase [Acidobacteriota bacterium]|nr:M14-type cytosolic carboxypeptidase [Acidobacteriota bacterium]
MTAILRIPAVVFLVWGLAFPADPIRVTDAFESGSLGLWRVEDGTRLIIIPVTEYDQDHINSAVTWFYGRLSNVFHREVTIQLEGLDYTVYNGRKGNVLPFERNTVPVFSYDGLVWERFTDCSFRKEDRTFRIRQIFSRDTVWIAYIPPYTFSRLESLLDELRAHPTVKIETIGQSVEGRPLYLVNVSESGQTVDSRPVVWVVARQHAFEAGGSWAVEGLLRFLTGPDPEAESLRKQILFKVCPMLNPDGVVRGGTRFNARGIDLNRHWHSNDPLSTDVKSAPEIAQVKRAVSSWRANHRLDLWINIHNNDMVWNDDGDYIRFAPPDREAGARRLEALLRQETAFTGPFEPTGDRAATEAVVAAETGALSLLMEMKTGYLSGADRWTGVDVFLAHGRGLARTASRFFSKE